MKTTIAIFLATTGLASASLIPITLDIGPTREFAHAQIVFDLDFSELVGDGHKTFVITFANDQFIRLTDRSTRNHGAGGAASFEIGLSIDVPALGVSFGGGIFPLVNYDGELPLLIYGATFDWQLPVQEGALITGGHAQITSNEFFGIGPHVPESGSTIWLTVATLAGLAVLGRKQ